MSTFLTEFRAVHTRSLAFAAALPLVAAVPLVAEFIQHVVEMRIGMYASPDAAEATADNAQRLHFGFAKVIALSLPAYFFFRWLHSGGGCNFAMRIEGPAAGLFALVLALQALFAWLSLFVWTDGPMGIEEFIASFGDAEVLERERAQRPQRCGARSTVALAAWPHCRIFPALSEPHCRASDTAATPPV